MRPITKDRLGSGFYVGVSVLNKVAIENKPCSMQRLEMADAYLPDPALRSCDTDQESLDITSSKVRDVIGQHEVLRVGTVDNLLD